MKLGFEIGRIGVYRLFGPVIDEALRQGHEVECWHDYSHGRVGLKGYQFPSLSAAPAFAHGRPVLKPYEGLRDLGRLAAGVDAAVAVAGAHAKEKADAMRGGAKRVVVQHGIDLFHNSTPSQLAAYDLIGMHTAWWLEWAGRYYERQAASWARVARDVQRKTAAIGMPALDQRRLVDPREVRRRLGIPASQPVVVLLPFPGSINPWSFWVRKIHLEPWRLRRALNSLAHRRLDYWRRAWERSADIDAVKALRRFCDRNGALLLAKWRRKTPLPGYTRALADRCLDDASDYPATIMEVLAIANLCVGFYSFAVLEAAALGAPYLCLTFTAKEYYDDQAHRWPWFDSIFNAQEGGLFQYRGVSSAMTISEGIAALAGMRLADFTTDADARGRYVATYVGAADGTSSSRLLAAIGRVVGGDQGDGRSPMTSPGEVAVDASR